MGSCFASAPKQEINEHKRPSKLKVIVPKNPLLESHTVYKEMPFRMGDCFQLNKNTFDSVYEIPKMEPILLTEFGKYYQCVWKQNPNNPNDKYEQKRLVKIIKKSNDPKSNQSLDVIQNIYQLRYLDHPNILKIVEYFDEQEYFYLIHENFDGGCLVMKFINKGQDQEYMSAIIAEQLLSAIGYLHQKNLIYRYICHQFILCDDNLNIMLVECGAIQEVHDIKVGELIGDVHYQSPEMMYGKFGLKSDVWAIGVLTHFLLSESMPFEGILQSQIKNAIMRGETKLDTFEWDKKPLARQFIQKLLQFNQKFRPSAKEALNDKWIEKAKQKKSQLKLHPALSNLKRYQKCEVLVEAITMQIAQMTLSFEQKAEIKRIFTEFDTNNDGLISTQELIEGYKKYQTQTKLTDIDIQNLVNKIDSNGNGKLDYSEFLLACQDKKSLLSAEKLKLVFAQLDVDKDNTLSMIEMRRIFGGNRISDKNWHNILRKTNLHQKTVLSEIEFLEFISKAIKSDNLI